MTTRGARGQRAPAMTPLDLWIDRYLAYVAAERGLAPNTVAAYASDLAALARFAAEGGWAKPGALTAARLRQFLTAARRRGLGSRSQARMAAALRGFERFLVLERVIPVAATAEVQVKGGVPPLPVEELSIDRLVAEGRVCMGTPDECAAVVERAREALGLTGIDCTFYFGGIDYPRARASLELFAREVMPRFQRAAQPVSLHEGAQAAR